MLAKATTKVELGNKLDEVKSSINEIKEETIKEADSSGESAEEEVSLTDIHQALADFRTEIG